MPTNLYGPGDNFHAQNAHVLPALIGRFHEARETGADHVTLWGTGTPRREFLHVDDMAAAALFVMNLPRETYAAHTKSMQSHINIGTGRDIAIMDLAHIIADVIGFTGKLLCEPSKPDGAPRKLLDISIMTGLGWAPKITLRAGIGATYDWYRALLGTGTLRVG